LNVFNIGIGGIGIGGVESAAITGVARNCGHDEVGKWRMMIVEVLVFEKIDGSGRGFCGWKTIAGMLNPEKTRENGQ
jgi:hypothetical protein